MRQKYQNLRLLQTAISQGRNKLLTNFQRLESTTIHGHMVCVQKSDMKMTKNGPKVPKFGTPFNCNILRNRLLTNFQRLESTSVHELLYFKHLYVILKLW